MCLSVVIINLNNSCGIRKTLESVARIRDKSLNVIVIDGGSEDDSLLEIEKFSHCVNKIISEKDEGIFYAMNKGLNYVDSKWVCMMNSGDCFSENFSLELIDFKSFDDYKIVYGDWISAKRVKSPLPLDLVKVGIMPFCHQACFIRSDLRYSLDYKVYADYALVAQVYYENPKNFFYINTVIAIYEGGGLSNKVSFAKRKDKYLACYKYFGLLGFIRAVIFRLLTGNIVGNNK